MHSEIFLEHPNLLIQSHLQGNKWGEIVANFLLYLAKMLNPPKFWGPLDVIFRGASVITQRKLSEKYATISCETHILHAMLYTLA
jgi:hypothetical protein